MPTLNLVTSVGADDARERNDNTLFNGTSTTMDVTSDPTSGSRWNAGALFDPVNIANGDTIDTATLTPYFNTATLDDMHADWGCQDVDDAVNFTTDADVTTRVASVTTAVVAWVANSVGAGYQAMPTDFKGPIQEIVNRAGWASGQAICVLGRGNSDAAAIARLSTIEAGSGGMKLDITYTAASGWAHDVGGVANANIGKVAGVALASIGKINTVA